MSAPDVRERELLGQAGRGPAAQCAGDAIALGVAVTAAMLLAAGRAAMCEARRLPPPPRWSADQWAEEAGYEGTCSAAQAAREFDPRRGVPLEAFLRVRAVDGARDRYRREWSYGGRMDGSAEPDSSPARGAGEAAAEAGAAREVQAALASLPECQRRLLERVYWDGCTEAALAAEADIRQQTMHVRKGAALRALQAAVLRDTV